MNIKKLFAVLAGVSMLATQLIPAGALAATYSAELEGAYNWAHDKGITTMSSIDNANMYGAITRAEQAKMLSVYAMEVLGLKPDTSRACSFTDIDSVKGDLHDYIITSCQLGLMGQGITAFRPYDTISRAEFGTALSRLLWGSQYEGGTPYYVNHLNALKAAGIMTNIANAESTKEVRGYVMLMLQRSEGSSEGGSSSASNCDDPMVKVACSMDTDACPAACKTSAKDDEPTVVKAGDLAVTAKAAAGRKILIGGISDLDTLTFRTSEEVTLTKVILERYGYSQNDDVVSVWLEDEDGNIIAEGKPLDSKGQAKLSIKKDYRTIDGSYVATIVVNANGTGGNTMWFKVVDVESTAENLNVDNYSPYTYDMVAYAWATVTLSTRVAATAKDYNFESGEEYEIAKFKVQAPADSAVLLRGFSLDNTYDLIGLAGDEVDVERYLENVVVKVDGKAIKAKYSVDRDAKVTISFDDVEVAAKSKVEFTVSESFSEDFDSYDKYVRYTVNEKDFNGIDAKTQSRVKLNVANLDLSVYHFVGGKVKFSNVKVGAVDAAYGSVDVKVAEWSVTTSEALRGTFTIYAKNAALVTWWKAYAAVETMKVSIAWEEYDVTPTLRVWTVGSAYKTWDLVVDNTGKVYEVMTGSNAVAAGDLKLLDGVPYTFTNVDIEKWGKVVVKVDVQDLSDFNNAKVSFTTLNGDAFSSLVYEDTRRLNAKQQIAGFVTLYDLTVKPAKAALKNDLTTAVEFLSGSSNTKVVFDGSYTAKNGTVRLTEWTVKWTDPSAHVKTAKFYLSIDGDEVDDMNIKSATVAAWLTAMLPTVTINNGESVNIKIEAEVEWTSTGDLGTFQIIFAGEDENENPAGSAKANTIGLKVVEKGTISIQNDAAKSTALRKSAGSEMAKFRVKPGNKSSEVDFDSIEFILSGSTAFSGFDEYDVTLSIWGETEDVSLLATGADFAKFRATLNKTLQSEGEDVLVVIEPEVAGKVLLTGLKLNDIDQTKTFSKYFVQTLVSFASLEDAGTASYTYKFAVEGESTSVSSFKIYTSTGNCVAAFTGGALFTTPVDLSDGDTVSIKLRADGVQEICGVTYTADWDDVEIAKVTYPDYFKINEKTIDLPKA